MSKEELLEERKLLAVKSWFSRSVSSISSNNGSVEAIVDGSSSIASVSKDGVVDNGTGITPLRQLSMRSRLGGEADKELGTGSPMTPRNITPLTPLTPLRWKSNPREQDEEERAIERSRLGSMGSVGIPHDDCLGVQPVPNFGKEERAPEIQKQVVSVHEPVPLICTTSVDELSLKAQAGNVDGNVSSESTDSSDRKLSSGDDVMTMTIEFLRARLLSERSASKTAKLKVQQLVTTVSELEQKLDQAIEDRKKAEIAAQEAVMKLKLAESSRQLTEKASGEVSDKCTLNLTKGLPLSRSKLSQEDTKFSQPGSNSHEDLSRTNSSVSSAEGRRSTTKNQLPEIASMINERTVEEGTSDMKPVLQNPSEFTQESPQNQSSRAAIAIRLRYMWSKINEEMTALADERSDEVVLREELMSWMNQVPTVLQDIISEKVVSPSLGAHLRSESEIIKPHGASEIVNVRHSEPAPQVVQGKVQLQGDAKRVALLHEHGAAHESLQREWRRNYQEHQRKLWQGDDLNDNRSPKACTRQRDYDPNGLVDDSSFLGSHHARLAKSKSTLDLPTSPTEYSSDMHTSYRQGPPAESDCWVVEGPGSHRTSGRHPGSVLKNTPNDSTTPNRNRMFPDRSAAPSMLQEVVHEPWLGRKLDRETAFYFEESGNQSYSHGNYAPHSEGLPDRSQFSTNRLSEDGYRNPRPDLKTGQTTCDDRDQGHSGQLPQAHPRYNDGSNQIERDTLFRGSEKKDLFQPESSRRHRHRRSHSDSNDWPAVEDYGLLLQQHEPGSGLGRRQSYSGYPAAMDLSLDNFEKTYGSSDDPHHSDERMYDARGQRRDSFLAGKVDNAFGHQHLTQNYHPTAEPTLSLGYGPAYDAPKESSPVQQGPKNGLNKNVSDVLRALQIAKANIQSGSKGSKEQRPSGDRASSKTGHGMEHCSNFMQTMGQVSPEQLRCSESQQPHSEPSRAVFYNAMYNPFDADSCRGRYELESDAFSGTNTDSTYVDQLNVGKGIQFFFPG